MCSKVFYLKTFISLYKTEHCGINSFVFREFLLHTHTFLTQQVTDHSFLRGKWNVASLVQSILEHLKGVEPSKVQGYVISQIWLKSYNNMCTYLRKLLVAGYNSLVTLFIITKPATRLCQSIKIIRIQPQHWEFLLFKRAFRIWNTCL